jgi:hypothetical protein
MRDVWKSLDTQKIDDLCIKYHILYFKILMVQFNFKYLVVVSQKNPIFDTQKIENELFMRKKENTQNEHYLRSQEAHVCTI